MNDNTKKCPYCAEEIHVEALKCKHCREVLDDNLRTERESKHQVQTITKKQSNTESNHQTKVKRKKKSSYIGWIVALLIVVGITMPFHYLPEHGMVFPKDNLTFSNTFIFQKDVDRLIRRHNNAGFYERQTIIQEPLFRKLMEKGVISNKE